MGDGRVEGGGGNGKSGDKQVMHRVPPIEQGAMGRALQGKGAPTLAA